MNPSEEKKDNAGKYNQERESHGEAFKGEITHKKQHEPQKNYEKAGLIWRYCLITQFISPFPDKIETYEGDEETMREIREVNPIIYHGCEDWEI